jgi:acetoin utilization deacetylase AcuC-like enzyme
VLNIPLVSGTQTHEFLNAYESIFKKLKEFKPQFILLSAGFDAHKDDPLAQINLESKDYYTLTKRILTIAKEICGGKIVSILEGGYDLNALKESVNYHVKSLLE